MITQHDTTLEYKQKRNFLFSVCTNCPFYWSILDLGLSEESERLASSNPPSLIQTHNRTNPGYSI